MRVRLNQRPESSDAGEDEDERESRCDSVQLMLSLCAGDVRAEVLVDPIEVGGRS